MPSTPHSSLRLAAWQAAQRQCRAKAGNSRKAVCERVDIESEGLYLGVTAGQAGRQALCVAVAARPQQYPGRSETASLGARDRISGVSMSSTFDVVAKVISETSEIPL